MMKKLTFETLVESIRICPQIVSTVSAQLKKLLPSSIAKKEKVGTPSPQLQIPFKLKVDEFSHQFLGQLNTYVSWYKKNIMTDGDNPPVGILLCTRKDHTLVEYALAGMDNQLFMERRVRWKQI